MGLRSPRSGCLWRSRCYRGWDDGAQFRLFCRDGKLLLNAAGELILAFGGDEGVFTSHLQIAMVSDLRGFDGATADLLPPRDIRTPERVRPEAFEVAPLCLRGLMQCVADAGVPQRLPGARFCRNTNSSAAPGPLTKAEKRIGQIADIEYPAAILALGTTDLLMPDTLLDFDRGSREFTCFHLSPRTSEILAPVAMQISMINRYGSSMRTSTRAVSSNDKDAALVPCGASCRVSFCLTGFVCLPPKARGSPRS